MCWSDLQSPLERCGISQVVTLLDVDTWYDFLIIPISIQPLWQEAVTSLLREDAIGSPTKPDRAAINEEDLVRLFGSVYLESDRR